MNDTDNREAFSALRALEQWDWNKTSTVDAVAFDKTIASCWAFLKTEVPKAQEQTPAALRSLYEHSNHRLGVFLRDFGDRLCAAEKSHEQEILEEAIQWSVNQYERSILASYAEDIATNRVAGLYDDNLSIDDLIVRIATGRWQKVAMIVGKLMDIRGNLVGKAIAERVIALVESGALEAQGDLSRMDYSEVRLATT